VLRRETVGREPILSQAAVYRLLSLSLYQARRDETELREVLQLVADQGLHASSGGPSRQGTEGTRAGLQSTRELIEVIDRRRNADYEHLNRPNWFAPG
jgi:hypothetical protein